MVSFSFGEKKGKEKQLCFFLWFFSFLFPQRGKLLFFSSFVFFSSPKGSLPPRRGRQKEGRNSPSGTCPSLEEGRRETNETEANEPKEEIVKKRCFLSPKGCFLPKEEIVKKRCFLSPKGYFRPLWGVCFPPGKSPLWGRQKEKEEKKGNKSKLINQQNPPLGEETLSA